MLADACHAVSIQREFAFSTLRRSLVRRAAKRIKRVFHYYSYDVSFLCHGLLFSQKRLGGGALVEVLAERLGASVAPLHVPPFEELLLKRVFGGRVVQSIADAMRADTRRMLQLRPVGAFMAALQVTVGGVGLGVKAEARGDWRPPCRSYNP